MNRHKVWYLLALVLLLAGGIPLSVTAAQADWSAKVDPIVMQRLALEGTTRFHVVMAVQADVSAAAKLPTKVAKTTYVFETLMRTARETQAPLLSYLQHEGITFKSRYIYNVIEVEGTMAAVQWLAGRAEVARIVAPPDPQLEPVIHTIPVAAEPAGTTAVEGNIIRVNADDVWAMGYTGQGMVVGDNDTGMEYTHPALVNHYRGNLGGGNFDHNYNWWDAWGGTPSPTPVDYDGHGTHTAGTMVGDDGGSNQIGVAPGAKIIACAGLNLECLEFFLAPWDLNGQNPDPTKSPDSINNSWYDPSGYDYRPIVLNLNAAGIAVIKSAGNNGSGCGTISNPGYVPEIIATAAFDHRNDVIASFSSRGPMSNYGPTILKPEVAAPGVNVRSSVPGGGYDGTYSGTSMAAPHTTALVALMWSAAPCLQGDVPTTKQIMMDTAQSKIDAQCPPFVDHPNDVWGWGVLDAQAAVQAAMAMCGGQGVLNGTVTDAVTTSPIVSATVTATRSDGWGRTLETDASGFYTTSLPNGAYTVTAAAFGYVPAAVQNVPIVTDTTTTQDFALDPLDMYVISGVVVEAATGNPLAAVVEVLNTPIAAVATDPATGYYSVTVPAGTYTMRASSGSLAPGYQDVVADHDQTVNFLLYGFCDYFADDVEQGNLGWTAQSPWAITTAQSHSPTHSWTDSPSGSYGNNANTALTSPVWDLTGYSGVVLSFWHRYATESGYDFCHVEYTTDGTTWNEIAVYDGSQTTWTYQEFDIPEADNQATVRVRFRLTTDVSVTADGWYVDDVVLSAGGAGCLPPVAPVAEFESNSPILDGELAVFTNTTTGPLPIAYEWAFGDGATSTDEHPTHTYPAPGTYDVVLTATNAAGSDTVTHPFVVECAPVSGADFIWQPLAPFVGETVAFTGTAQGTAPLTFTWNFGDGGTDAGANVGYAYADAGTYTVTMAAANACPSQVEVAYSITVQEVPCDEVQIVTYTADIAGCVVTFGAELTGTAPFAYAWDFGALGTSTETNPVVDFLATGVYTVTLDVTNCTTGHDTVTFDVAVACEPPATYIIYLPVVFK